VGLATSSADSSRLNTARFSNVVVRMPQQPFNPGVEEQNWPVPRVVPRVSLVPSGQSIQLMLKVEDHPNHRHQLQRSSDLVDWQPVALLDNRSGTTFFVDSILSTSSQRFYRVVVLP
jgi:hypothetical protein